MDTEEMQMRHGREFNLRALRESSLSTTGREFVIRSAYRFAVVPKEIAAAAGLSVSEIKDICKNENFGTPAAP